MLGAIEQSPDCIDDKSLDHAKHAVMLYKCVSNDKNIICSVCPNCATCNKYTRFNVFYFLPEYVILNSKQLWKIPNSAEHP